MSMGLFAFPEFVCTIRVYQVHDTSTWMSLSRNYIIQPIVNMHAALVVHISHPIPIPLPMSIPVTIYPTLEANPKPSPQPRLIFLNNTGTAPTPQPDNEDLV